MTIDQLIASGMMQLTHTATPLVDARLLLQHLLGCSMATLIVDGEREISAENGRIYFDLIARAAQQEPIPYIIGHIPFRHLDLRVTPDVLIPRPETEQLVDLALAWIGNNRPQTIVDVGTGSGCIALSLAQTLAQPVHAIDLSEAALAVARDNAQRNSIERITFYQGSLLEPLPEPPDCIVANLPYISEAEWTELSDGVKYHEPKMALTAADNGLGLIVELLQQARQRMRPRGAIFLEIGWQQGIAALDAARAVWPEATLLLKQDYAGRDRFIELYS